jgi:hypothetical protein
MASPAMTVRRDSPDNGVLLTIPCRTGMPDLRPDPRKSKCVTNEMALKANGYDPGKRQ